MGPWWPHPIWGAGDQAGSSNWVTPEKVLEAISLVRTGKIYELGQVYESKMPFFGDRSLTLVIPNRARDIGKDKLAFFEEFMCTNIGQVGTQFDGPGHIAAGVDFEDGTVKDVLYNGYIADEIAAGDGLQKLGVENVKPFIVPAILIDVAGFKGVTTLNESYEVTLDDVRGALSKQGMTEDDIKAGDAILFNYGHSELWATDPVAYYATAPGIGLEVGAWIVERNASMVGSDGWGTEVFPNPDEERAFPLHIELLVKAGIWKLESMVFDSVLEDELYKFLFVFTPLRIKGATGAPSRPLAIG